MTIPPSDTLKNICERRLSDVRMMQQALSLNDIILQAKNAPTARGFIRALQTKTSTPALITEIKKGSPSRGLIRPDFHPAMHANDLQMAGASCISVLTEPVDFLGHDDDLTAVRANCTIPALRKDFIVDEWQIYQTRALGADCMLLIVAALDDAQLSDYHQLATELGMDVLVEIHDEAELDRALRIEQIRMLGVNNRNLKTLKVDTGTSLKLINSIPDNILRVSESGISDPNTLKELYDSGYQAFLIGEYIMSQSDIKSAVNHLLSSFPA